MIRIMKYGETDGRAIFGRSEAKNDVSSSVAAIIAAVRENGDKALFELTERFDRVRLDSLEVAKEEIDAAFDAVGEDFTGVLERAAANIKEFHSKQKRSGFEIKRDNGSVIGQRVIPLDRVGIYVPGGTAAYPSTVLMDSIPAKIAGVGEIIMVTPPGRDGRIKPEVLAAAWIAGIDRIFRIGGAQAVAALAYGTATVPKVDKIVGPGNAYVAEAKRQVFGEVSIDMIAGPSEILVIADGGSDPVNVAADLLSQAEHDRMASAVLITDSDRLADKVALELERQIPLLPRKDIARESIDANGKIIVVSSLEEAAEISNSIAPEHLELCVDDPFGLLGSIKHAGSVFLGRYCAEAVGDYYAGPNHTLPTGGTARFSSPLSVDDFVKKTQYCYYSEEALREAAPDIVAFARSEGLDAHAESIIARTEERK